MVWTATRSSFGCIAYGGFDIHQSVCRYNSQGFVSNNNEYFHDNLIEYINESGDGVKHSNSYELNGNNTALFWYNNLVRHIGLTSAMGVNLWFNPSSGLFAYNNLVYDIHAGGNYWDIAGTGGTYYLYNNTLQDPTIANNTFQPPIVSYNNHFIGATSQSGVFLSPTNLTDGHSVYQTDAQANAQGYTAADQYAPTSSSGATVGAGSNLTSSCSSNFAQLCSDTTLACLYDSTNHLVSCPSKIPTARPTTGVWDSGAYEFGGSGAPPPPSNLVAIPQ